MNYIEKGTWSSILICISKSINFFGLLIEQSKIGPVSVEIYYFHGLEMYPGHHVL